MSEVRWTPLLFKPEMVLAILRGDKTNTRRLVKPQPIPAAELGDEEYDGPRQFFIENGELRTPARYGSHPVPCPYGGPGDMIWGRETWRSWRWNNRVKPREFVEKWGDRNPRDYVGYDADNDLTRPSPNGPIEMDGKTRVSIHMPRWASRLHLRIESVKLERLQDISEEDARAEGISEVTKDGRLMKYCVLDRGDMSSTPWAEMPRSPREAFALLWESINGNGSWDLNPWVWAIKFRRLVDGT